jgi:hypothetical protein
MNGLYILFLPELETWPHTQISGESLFLDLLHNVFVMYDYVGFGRVYYNSVLLLAFRKAGRLYHKRRYYIVYNLIKYPALKPFLKK